MRMTYTILNFKDLRTGDLVSPKVRGSHFDGGMALFAPHVGPDATGLLHHLMK